LKGRDPLTAHIRASCPVTVRPGKCLVLDISTHRLVAGRGVALSPRIAPLLAPGGLERRHGRPAAL